MDEKILAVDIETTGLNPYQDRITCIGVYGSDFQKVYRNLSDFKSDLTNLLADYKWVGHNFKFDAHFLIVNGIDKDLVYKNWAHDTQLMAHTWTTKISDDYIAWYEEERLKLNKALPMGVSHRRAQKHSLKTLAPYFLEVAPFWENPENHDSDEYVLKDCLYTFNLFNFLKKALTQDNQYQFYLNKMLPWSKMLLTMELKGIQIDLNLLEKMKQDLLSKETTLHNRLDEQWKEAHQQYYNNQIADLEKQYKIKLDIALEKLKSPSNKDKTEQRYKNLLFKAKSKLDSKINYDSPKQMLWLLKDFLKYPVLSYNGNTSTGKAVLEKLAKSGHEDIKVFLDYRKVNKILTSYLPKYQELSHKSVIHPTFNLTGTRTGRLSSSDPNMQQVAPELYKLFKPRKGYKFVQYDLSGIEAALIALYSEDPKIFELIQKGHSIHNANAKVFFNLTCPIEDIKDKYPKQRQAAKTIGFALFYGAGPNRLKHVFNSHGFMISEEEAKKIYYNFKDHYRHASNFHREITDLFESGRCINNLLGRPIKIEHPGDAYMKGFNALIQSSASDLNIRAAQLSQEEWKSQGLSAQLLLLVHDFILAEVLESDAEKAEQILKEKMTGFKLLNSLGKVPLTVEGGIFDVWTK